MIANPLEQTAWFHLGPVPLQGAVIITWIVMAGLVILGVFVGRSGAKGSAAREAAMATLEIVERELGQALGQSPAPYLPYLGTLFLLIATANLTSLVPGVEAPTARPETTAALALTVFGAVQVFAIRARGFKGYLKHFLDPHPLFLPFNILGEFTRILSLMVRLFGNMMSHGFVIAILLSVAGLLVPVPFMALGVLIGLVQAYIFTILAAVYIAAATHEGEG